MQSGNPSSGGEEAHSWVRNFYNVLFMLFGNTACMPSYGPLNTACVDAAGTTHSNINCTCTTEPVGLTERSIWRRFLNNNSGATITVAEIGLVATSFLLSLLIGIALFNIINWLTPRIPFQSGNESVAAVGIYVFGYLVFFGLIVHAALTMPL